MIAAQMPMAGIYDETSFNSKADSTDALDSRLPSIATYP